MKERLTGAVILVALIVLLVPELLTGPVRSAPRANRVASSAEEPPLRSYTIKLADDTHPRSTAVHSGPEQPAPLATSPAASAGTATAQPEAEEPRPVASSTATTAGASPVTSAAAAPPEASAMGAGTYVVQLGSFASRANANRLAQQVRAQGFAVSVSQGQSGHLYRVRVGPAHDRAAASELAQQLRARGHSGAIVPQ